LFAYGLAFGASGLAFGASALAFGALVWGLSGVGAGSDWADRGEARAKISEMNAVQYDVRIFFLPDGLMNGLEFAPRSVRAVIPCFHWFAAYAANI
jgi:hypothetical protein